ncbi:MAG: hypothetical protein HRU34_17010, partial [Richelia sp.]|nr:hypothetical protein [Richelia sp.]
CCSTSILGVAESGDHFTKFSTISQCFQTLIHAALMQRRILNMTIAFMGFRPALFFLGLSCTCSKIGRNYDHGTVSSNFINRVFLLSNFWYRCSSSPTFFIPWRFNPSFCSPYTLISLATCSIFRGAD